MVDGVELGERSKDWEASRFGGGDIVTVLVFGSAKVPCLDHVFLSGIDVGLVLHLANTDAHAVLGEDDVLLVHLLGGRLAHYANTNVDLVGDPCAS